MYALGRVLSAVIFAVSVFGGIVVAVMMVHIFVDVSGRYLFGNPLPATISIVSHYYMVAVAFLPLAMCEKRDAHISVEVMMQLFPAPVQRHTYAWTWLYSAGIFMLLTHVAWIDAERKRAIGTFVLELGYRVPVWPAYYLLPLGYSLIAAVLVYKFLIYVTGARSGLGETYPWSAPDPAHPAGHERI
ncbi:MAG: TRAP transporter small permease [Alphaproteobacteria bacterium]